MSSPLLDLDALKALYKKGMNYAMKKYHNPFMSNLTDLCNYQLQLAEKAQDLNTFMNVFWIANPVFQNAFWSPKPVCTGCELQLTPVQFGVSTLGWYFLYGIAGQYAYNISVFRAEIAPPDVVDVDRSEAVRWIIMGGYGVVGGDWYEIKPEWMYLKYTQPSYSTFSLSGTSSSMIFSFTSAIPMQFQLNLTYTDVSGTQRVFSSQLVPNAPPNANVPGSYKGLLGSSTMYYSYTDMIINISVNNEPALSGHGWIDHQLLASTLPKTLYEKSILGALSAISKNKSRGWLWFAIQDYEDGNQYMLHHFLNSTSTYSDQISVGKEISPFQISNVYNKGVPHFSPKNSTMSVSDLKVVMTSTSAVLGVNLPSKYNITLPGGKKVVLSVACKVPNVFPVPHAPYECPAYLYDESGTRVIGLGLIEANWYLSYDQIVSRLISVVGGNAQNTAEINTVMSGIVQPQTVWQKIISILVVLFPLWLLIFFIIFILHKKTGRKIRLLLCLGIFLFFIGISRII